MSTPKISRDAISYGEPRQHTGLSDHEHVGKGGCAAYHAQRPQSYFTTIKFWKTPLTTCDNGTTTALALLNGNSLTQITG